MWVPWRKDETAAKGVHVPKKPAKKLPVFYTYPYGYFVSAAGGYPISRPARSASPQELSNFRSRALRIAEDMTHDMETMLTHLKNCAYGDPELAKAAEMAEITAKSAEELLDKTKKYLK